MSDDEYIESVRIERKESVDFFSSSKRHEREIWVANEFLSNLGMSFGQSELLPVTNDPPDIRFRSAEFEVKEILDPGRRRHEEFKRALEKANTAKTHQDLIEYNPARDIQYTEIFALIKEAVLKYSVKYSEDVKSNMDLLFYVNLEDTRAYIANTTPSQDALNKSGFRSISFVAGALSGVLMANDDAPDFLRSDIPRVIRKK